jgi:DNA-directed RNA polymerase subunit RPC12/RpoP
MNTVYLVCDDCGFFYGDIRLYEEQTVDCPTCGSTVAKAFGQIEHALDYQAMFAPREENALPALWVPPTQPDPRTAPWYEDPAGKPPYLGPIP